MPKDQSTPKDQPTYQELLAAMPPAVLAREMMREHLVSEGEDGGMADQFYDNGTWSGDDD